MAGRWKTLAIFLSDGNVAASCVKAFLYGQSLFILLPLWSPCWKVIVLSHSHAIWIQTEDRIGDLWFARWIAASKNKLNSAENTSQSAVLTVEGHAELTNESIKRRKPVWATSAYNLRELEISPIGYQP
jgi:hypothetical protein